MWQGCTTAAGFRIFGTSVGGFDFSLNYANIPVGLSATFNFSEFPLPHLMSMARRTLPHSWGSRLHEGTFEEGLRRCLNNRGSQGNALNYPSQTPGNEGTLLLADLNGYNHPRSLRPQQPERSTWPIEATLAGPAWGSTSTGDRFVRRHIITSRTHVIGFTSTYNDFEYTGAVFRTGTELQHKEHVRKLPAGSGRNSDLTGETQPKTGVFCESGLPHLHAVWRSMVGFDLLKSVPSLRYIPFLHHSFYDQAWFFTGQWLMKNQWSNIANPLLLRCR